MGFIDGIKSFLLRNSAENNFLTSWLSDQSVVYACTAVSVHLKRFILRGQQAYKSKYRISKELHQKLDAYRIRCLGASKDTPKGCLRKGGGLRQPPTKGAGRFAARPPLWEILFMVVFGRYVGYKTISQQQNLL